MKNRALDDPQAFLDVDLNDHLGEIDAKDLATLDQLQQSLRSGKHDPQLDLERVYKDNIDRTLRGLDLPATDIAKLYHQIDRDLAGHQAATGRKATPAEQQKMADQAVIDMKLDQRGFVMTRYGALISTTGNAANAKDNPLFIQTAGGDLHFANDAEPQGMPEEGSLKDLFGGQEMLVSGPASATDRWRDEGARDRMVWQLAYPAGNVDPLYTGERKVIGPAELPDEGKSKAIMERERKNRELVREAELAIRYLQPAEVNPLSGPLVLLKKEEGGTGTFGYSRMDEFGNPKKHGGVDLVAPEGSPVYAIKPGEVIIERKSETYGYQVIIDHGNRLYSQYAHMDGKIVRRKNQSGGSDLVFVFKDKDGQAKELKSGDSVMAGTQIGAVGHTGNAGGGKAHLHLEIRYGNNGVDPNTRVLINPMYFLR